MPGTVVLVTDYGVVDHYAASLVGACLRVDPGLRVEHGSHGVPFGDVLAGAWRLSALAADFPQGTVLCGVVDPGVGSARGAIAIEAGEVRCVAPDTGLVHWLWEDADADARAAVRLTVGGGAAPTFHGRDVFAPAAARLAAGAALPELGASVAAPVLLEAARVADGGDGLGCRVVGADRFGNLVTTLRTRDLGGRWLLGASWASRRGPGRTERVARTYAEIGIGLALLVGGSGHVELAADSASAAELSGLRPGDAVRVEVAPAGPDPRVRGGRRRLRSQ